MLGLQVAFIGCVVGLAACPLVAFAVVNRRYRDRSVDRRKFVGVYYAIVVASSVVYVGTIRILYPISSGFGDVASTALAVTAFASLVAAVLAGPFVASDVLQVAESLASQAKICIRCAYNLTGNISGKCPECGTPTRESAHTPVDLRHRIRYLPWGKVMPLWIVWVTLVTGLLGYVRVKEAWVCSECCVREIRLRHQFRIPFGGPELVEIKGGTQPPRPRPLTRLLDPDGQCGHRWIGNGVSGEGLTSGVRGIGVDLCISGVQDQPDFVQFVNDRSDVLNRIRASVRQSELFVEWLLEEYLVWKESASEETPRD